jgi:hypothetical protein
VRTILTAFFLMLSAPTLAQTQKPVPTPPVNCTDVQVGSAESYSCINAKLGAIANDTERFSSQDAPVNSSSPSNVVGTFNESGTRNRLGANFGKSAIPYRPAPANPAALPGLAPPR